MLSFTCVVLGLSCFVAVAHSIGGRAQIFCMFCATGVRNRWAITMEIMHEFTPQTTIIITMPFPPQKMVPLYVLKLALVLDFSVENLFHMSISEAILRCFVAKSVSAEAKLN